jgi:hypothetical protein
LPETYSPTKTYIVGSPESATPELIAVGNSVIQICSYLQPAGFMTRSEAASAPVKVIQRGEQPT